MLEKLVILSPKWQPDQQSVESQTLNQNARTQPQQQLNRRSQYQITTIKSTTLII